MKKKKKTVCVFFHVQARGIHLDALLPMEMQFSYMQLTHLSNALLFIEAVIQVERNSGKL